MSLRYGSSAGGTGDTVVGAGRLGAAVGAFGFGGRLLGFEADSGFQNGLDSTCLALD